MSSNVSPVAQSRILDFYWTTERDLDQILALEQDQENSSFITPWKREQHLEAFSNRDVAHLVVKTKQDQTLIGFILLRGLEGIDKSIELKRIVIGAKGQGNGKEAIKLLKWLIFEKWKAHRLWLDVFDFNQRARHVYAAEGFIEEGTLRECIARGDRFESLVVMSLLVQEYFRSQV